MFFQSLSLKKQIILKNICQIDRVSIWKSVNVSFTTIEMVSELYKDMRKLLMEKGFNDVHLFNIAEILTAQINNNHDTFQKYTRIREHFKKVYNLDLDSLEFFLKFKNYIKE